MLLLAAAQRKVATSMQSVAACSAVAGCGSPPGSAAEPLVCGNAPGCSAAPSSGCTARRAVQSSQATMWAQDCTQGSHGVMLTSNNCRRRSCWHAHQVATHLADLVDGLALVVGRLLLLALQQLAACQQHINR